MAVKLWRATVEIEVLIASEDEPTAYEIADAAEEEMRDNSLNAETWPAEQITSAKDIPEEWRDSIPRGENHDDMTCEQIVEAAEKDRLEKAWNSPLPNQTALDLGE